jgi:hypothetical protein
MKRLTNNEFILSCKENHNIKYDYSLTNYIGASNKIIIICPIHGSFEQIARDHKRGGDCPICANEIRNKNKSIGSAEFIERCIKKHGNKYDYSEIKFINLKTNVIIKCPEHGEFIQRPSVHLNGEGCKKCYIIKRGLSQMLTTSELVDKFKEIHGDRYDYSKVIYSGYKNDIDIICSIHGEFTQLCESHLHGGNCNECNQITSKIELDVREFISSLNINFIENDRTILDGKELDIYIPSKNIAIEINGLYWHSEKFVSNSYHLNKTKLCDDKNIQLIHIFEDEWLNKQDIVKSRLRNILGLTNFKIYGRKCAIKEVDTKIKTKFLNDNHIQGTIGSKINLGLYYKDELISLMTFGKRPILNKNEYELIRFCNKLDTSVIGGASKLLKYFIRNHQPTEMISYADRRWSNGNLYEQLNFKFIENTKPNWFILNSGKREHRIKYQKHKLINMGFDKSKTAHQITIDNNLYRIYDCGTKKYTWSTSHKPLN